MGRYFVGRVVLKVIPISFGIRAGSSVGGPMDDQTLGLNPYSRATATSTG